LINYYPAQLWVRENATQKEAKKNRSSQADAVLLQANICVLFVMCAFG
jgi:hypothetical protein